MLMGFMINFDIVMIALLTVVIGLLFSWGFDKLTKYDLPYIEGRKRHIEEQEKELEKEKEAVKKLEAEYERRQKKLGEKIYGKHKKDDHEVSN
ncbi:hypothetical protein [Dolosigranulum pigrum]|uniref:hypothetical protein n=1 Tax=Dolosigranulum pigrum TaxID=29394 RepID=UPI001AD88FED|nr:hypothetical protein [Dolosigranulum pigrum]QTJ33394.1 hypothetical protein FE321_07230 [Dolosigranulum pigrum]